MLRPLLGLLCLTPLAIGQTTFTTTSALSCQRPDSIRTGDLDADGDVDTLTTHFGSNEACVQRNDGTGTGWVNSTLFTYAAGSLPTESVIANFDGGGRLDVAVVLNATAQVAIHLGTGAWPGFAPVQLVSMNQGPIEAAPIDYDSDGDIDLAVICDLPQVVQILENVGGVFTPSTTFPLLPFVPRALETGDVNADGRTDLVIGATQGGAGAMIVLVNTTPTPVSPPSFAAPQVFPVSPDPYGICIGDLDGDGYNDVATLSAATSSVDVLRNDPTALAGTTVGFTTANYSLAPGTIGAPDFSEIDRADFDCDGDLDLVASCNLSDRVAVLWNAGVGTFSAPAFFGSPLFPGDLAIDDFTGDGFPDIATANAFSASVGVLNNDLVVGCCEHRLIGGISDGFGTAVPSGPEDTCPAPDLLTWFGAGPRRDFDGGTSCSRSLLHTFRGLPGRIKSARLVMRMRADCPTSADDRFALGFDAANGRMVWARDVSELTGSPWVGPTFGGVSLDLGALPGGLSLLEKMSAEGRLDVVIGDGTAVDAIRLNLETCADSDNPVGHNATPYVTGTTITWSVGGAPTGPGAATAFLLGTGIGPGPTLPGGTLCITGPTILQVVATSLSGTATHSLSLPAVPLPPCINIATQAISWGPGFAPVLHSNTLTQQLFD